MQFDPSSKTYSDSWHKVAGIRAALRPSVHAWRQEYRGVDWYVLQDSLSNHFFRISLDAYAFVSRLTPDRSVGEAWNAALQVDPDLLLSQEEVVQLLGQLYLQNLLYFDQPAVSGSLFERFRKRRQREAKAKLMGFLSIRVPLFDPDRMLNRALPLIRFLYSPIGLLAYFVLLLIGVKALIDNPDGLFSQAGHILSFSNLPLLYGGFLIAKLVHEFSHAFACKRFGGEVHVMGVMLLVLTPMPYVDASASWGFREGWKRLVVGAAGMLGEFALAAIAALIWVSTAPGMLNALAYNVMFVASVSTLLFNINPLLRFDGYYMLVDLFALPNLFQRSRDQLKYLSERYLFGLRSARPAARTREEGWLLPSYGVVSLAYWVVLMSTIVFFVASEYLDLGILIALLLSALFVVVPLVKFLNYLLFSPRLLRQRARAIGVTAALLIVGLIGLGGWSVPDRVRTSGVVEANTLRELHSGAAGFLVELMATPGDAVHTGDALLRLHNPDLDTEIALAELRREQILTQELKAESAAIADLGALRRHRRALEERIADLNRQRDELVLRAPIDGIWARSAAPTAHALEIGSWVERGASFGTLVSEQGFRLVAAMPQVATHVFENPIQKAELRLLGEADINLVLTNGVRIIPFEHGELPSPMLGAQAGGVIAVSPEDPRGLAAAEPFFLIHAELGDGHDQPVRLMHGRIAELRLTLPPRPLLAQWERDFRQFLQRHFQV